MKWGTPMYRPAIINSHQQVSSCSWIWRVVVSIELKGWMFGRMSVNGCRRCLLPNKQLDRWCTMQLMAWQNVDIAQRSSVKVGCSRARTRRSRIVVVKAPSHPRDSTELSWTGITSTRVVYIPLFLLYSKMENEKWSFRHCFWKIFRISFVLASLKCRNFHLHCTFDEQLSLIYSDTVYAVIRWEAALAPLM